MVTVANCAEERTSLFIHLRLGRVKVTFELKWSHLKRNVDEGCDVWRLHFVCTHRFHFFPFHLLELLTKWLWVIQFRLGFFPQLILSLHVVLPRYLAAATWDRGRLTKSRLALMREIPPCLLWKLFHWVCFGLAFDCSSVPLKPYHWNNGWSEEVKERRLSILDCAMQQLFILYDIVKWWEVVVVDASKGMGTAQMANRWHCFTSQTELFTGRAEQFELRSSASPTSCSTPYLLVSTTLGVYYSPLTRCSRV